MRSTVAVEDVSRVDSVDLTDVINGTRDVPAGPVGACVRRAQGWPDRGTVKRMQAAVSVKDKPRLAIRAQGQPSRDVPSRPVGGRRYSWRGPQGVDATVEVQLIAVVVTTWT